jgi:hypothetical protein
MSMGTALTAFGHFWWEFIIGDTPEVAVGVACLIVVSWLLAHGLAIAAVVVLPLAVIALLTVSLYRGSRPT